MTRKPPAPEWLFLLALGMISALAELGFVVVNMSTLPVFLPVGLGLPNLPGIALTVYYVVEALANSPMGALADRLGRRRMMVLGTCLSIATCLCTSLLRAPGAGGVAALGVSAILLLLRALDGLGAAMLWPSVYASVSDRIAPERQAQATTMITIAYMASIPVAMKIGGYLNDHYGAIYPTNDPRHYADSFYFAALCFAATALLAYFTAPRRSTAPQEKATAIDHAPLSRDVLLSAFKRMPWLLGLIGLIFVAVGLVAPYVKLYFIERFHISEEAFGNLILGPAVIIGIVAGPLGRIGDKWGKTLPIRLGTALCALGLWGILFAPNERAIIGLGTMLGIGFVMAFPSYMAYVADIAPDNERGGMIGAVRMAQGIGAGVGTLLSSALYTADKNHHTIFYLSAGLLTLGFFLSFIVVKPPKK